MKSIKIIFLSFFLVAGTGTMYPLYSQSQIDASEKEKEMLRKRFENYRKKQEQKRLEAGEQEDESQSPTLFTNTRTADSLRRVQKEQTAGQESLSVIQESESGDTTLTDSLVRKLLKKKRMGEQEEDSLARGPAPVKPFGYDLFREIAPTFKPLVMGPVHGDYMLGPGDEIIVSIWGNLEKTYKSFVDRNGALTLPGAGRIAVNGLTLEKLKRKLISRYSRIHSGVRYGRRGATTHIEVSLGRLRSMQVFVLGEVKKPGGYIMSAASNAFHALYFAGGPTEKGSLRRIIVRKSEEKHEIIDFYMYLLEGKHKQDLPLGEGDIVFIPPVGTRVKVEGAVHRPAIYELQENETFKDLIKIFGDVNAMTYKSRLQIIRFMKGGDREVIDYLDAFGEKAGEIPLEDGDEIYIFKQRDKIEKLVKIKGFVKRPGTYAWRPDLTLSDLIGLSDGLEGDVYSGRVDIIRERSDLSHVLKTYNLEEIMSNKIKVDLENRDRVRIYSRWELEERDSIEIFGAVNIPGKYELAEGMTVADIIFMAGGYSDDALRDNAEVSRIDPATGRIKTHKVPVDSDYTVRKERSGFALRSYDNIFVRKNPDWELQRNVSLEGEFLRAGKYSLVKKNERLSELLVRAGGLKETAYLEGAKFYRKLDSIGRIGINLKKIIKKKKYKGDIILMDGDSLYVPRVPKTVKVEGEVGLPTNVLYKSGKGLAFYINLAGGYTPNADKKRVQIVLANGQVTQRGIFGNKINAGSRIIVPKKVEKEKTDWFKVFTVITGTVTTIAMIYIAWLGTQN
jgi:protein involved in polysaccharide export with SLBB domain